MTGRSSRERRRRGATAALAACATVAFGLRPALARAQRINASQHGIVAQALDSATITVEYDRPVARGRTPFPDVVRWGRVWTPGANWATTIEVDSPVHIDGNPLPAGKYSVWMIPRPDEWTVILSRNARRFHTQPPSSGDDEARFAVKPTTGAHMETLTFYFPIVTSDSATLDMHWGTTVVSLHITVDGHRLGASGRWGLGGAWSCPLVFPEVAHEAPAFRSSGFVVRAGSPLVALGTAAESDAAGSVR
jgi:hypothetical protein